VSAAVADQPRVQDMFSGTPELDSRSGGGGLTLEQLLDGVWEGLHATGAAECPLCHGRMTRTPSGGACGDCGSALA
jgi:hypothetical protein